MNFPFLCASTACLKNFDMFIPLLFRCFIPSLSAIRHTFLWFLLLIGISCWFYTIYIISFVY